MRDVKIQAMRAWKVTSDSTYDYCTHSDRYNYIESDNSKAVLLTCPLLEINA